MIMTTSTKKSTLTKIISDNKTSPQQTLTPVWHKAKAIAKSVAQESALPIEWETWLHANPNLNKEFFKQLQNLGVNDTLEFTKCIDAAVVETNAEGCVTTEYSHDGKAMKLAITGDLQTGIGAKEWKTQIGKWGEAQASATTAIGIGEKLEFTFAHPKDLESALQNTNQNAIDLWQLTQNPALFVIQKHFTSSSQSSMFNSLTGVELRGEWNGEVAAQIEAAIPNSGKKSLLASANASLGGNINATARIEWDEAQTPYLVFVESLNTELQSEMAVQLQAFKALSLKTNTNSNIQVAAHLQNEKRMQLPQDFNLNTISKESLLNDIKNSAQSYTETQTLTLNFEKPVLDKKNGLVVAGQELVFAKSFSVADLQKDSASENKNLGFTDLVNTFIGQRAPDSIRNYAKTEDSKAADVKIFGQGIGLSQNTVLTDVQ